MKTTRKPLSLLLALCLMLCLAACRKPDTSADDQAAADKVAALIDAIYVQKRTENTDSQCEEAKRAWDALTDAQKALVKGEFADPDYFGRDTGDASKDDPRNDDNIGKNELLVVSFGTSFNDSRVQDIKGIEDALALAYPDWSVRRAFTAQIIINHIQARDGEKIDNMDQALERAVRNGVENLVIQPTHLMHGAEYDELMEAVDNYRGRIANISVAEPLLGPVGSDAAVINADKQATAQALVAEALKTADFPSMEAAADAGVAFVFLGHGTSHNAKVTYAQMQTQMDTLGYSNAFIGTVEGEPEFTACEEVIKAVRTAGFKKVILRPLMVVAGDHANNDMAGPEEDSWISMFKAANAFDEVEAQIMGLGSVKAIQEIYAAHTAQAIEALGKENNGTGGGDIVTGELTDGTYLVRFDTDSGMFHVNDAHEGKGILTVRDGKMTVHIALSGKNIVKLFRGTAEDAGKEGTAPVDGVLETVKYADGTTDAVMAFDLPVPAIGEEFDCAILGTKGKWYDHKVSVSQPVKMAEKTVEVILSGGSGRASIQSPAKLIRDLNGTYWATVVWSSKNYAFMEVAGVRYDPVQTEGNATFVIPVVMDEDMPVSAQTVAMSTPHLVNYTLRFDSTTMKDA